MSYQVINPFIQFVDPATGRPLSGGSVYFGRMDTDPKNQPANRLNVYAVQDNGSEVLLAQPITLNAAGQPQYSGSVKQIKIELYSTEQAYAVQIFNQSGAQKGYTSRLYTLVDSKVLGDVGSQVLISGVKAEDLARKYEEFATVEDYGAVADGSTDDAAAFAAMQTAVGYVGLSPEATYFISALPNVSELKIVGRNATINFNTLLIDRSFDLLDIQDVNFDGQNSNVVRCIRVRKNSQIKFRNLNGYNMSSLTFVRMLDISTENVSIDIQDCYCQNLVSAEDGVIGNNNGATRFIYVGDEDATPLVSPSFGMIVNIRGNVLLPKEDGDMIHVQSADSKIFNITIDNIFGYKVAKRVVKVQANGVYISNVSADARDNPVAMYAIVSHYGNFGSIFNVSGAGKFEQGVDTQRETVQVVNVNITNTGTAVSQGAALKGSGGLFGRNIIGYGFEHIVGNYITLETDANTDIQGVYGTSTGVAAFIRASLVSGKVEIEDIKATQGSTSRLCQVTRTAANTFTIVDIKDVIGNSGLFTAIEVTGAAITKGRNIDINQTVSGIPFSVNAGEAYCDDITGRGMTTDAVFLNATTKAVVTRARGGTSAQVLTTGCNNTIVNNAICNAGIPASRNTGTASTNTQNVGTLTFV